MKKKILKKEIRTEGFMDFEHMLRQFFGDKAFGCQGFRKNINLTKRELKKVVLKIENRVDSLDTTSRHKETMLCEVEKLKNDLSKKEIDSWAVVIHLFSLVSRLLGYDYLKGFINTPVYHQTADQYYSQVIFEGGDVMQNFYDKKNLVTIRKKLYYDLKKEYSDFKIAQILNTTEYQIKKLKNAI